MSLIAFCIWAVAANFAGMLPSRRRHWPAAYALMVTGLPLLAWVFWTEGWIWGLLCLAAAISVLRWPAWYFWRWLNRLFGVQS
ncbi:MAG: DUF2484 family protein [Pseudomonadota bacterium]